MGEFNGIETANLYGLIVLSFMLNFILFVDL